MLSIIDMSAWFGRGMILDRAGFLAGSAPSYIWEGRDVFVISLEGGACCVLPPVERKTSVRGSARRLFQTFFTKGLRGRGRVL
ncbi:hypothetical protein, partial [Burkholderia cenocepacia]|uniref:hypothetical protein n=3 Tax=Burkholderia cepacia complex TaxID=87882 RepID=UPI001C8A2C0F